MYRVCCILFLSFLLTTPLAAQNLITQLPQDGTSVRFLLKIEGKRGKEDMAAKGMLSIGSVGRETVNDKPCRWIEVHYTTVSQTREIKLTQKLLIPEEHFKAGQSPLDHVVKAYIQRGNRKPEPFSDVRNALVSPIPILLCGPLENQKSLGKKSLTSKLDKSPLSCDSIQGGFTFQKEKRTIRCQVQTWQHKKAPFGVVQAELQNVRIGGETNFSMSLSFNAILKNTKSRLIDLE